MGSWLDKLARSSASSALPSEVVSDEAAGLTRRDALRRAGVVGAAVVAIPMMDSVLAPAYAATSGPRGKVCRNPSDPGLMCGGPGSHKEDDRRCQKCGFGAKCGENRDCITGRCVEPKGSAGKGVKGTCGPSPTGGRCFENSDCEKGATCSGYDANHVGTCKRKPQGGSNGPCTTDADCFGDKVCLNGTCSSKPKKK